MLRVVPPAISPTILYRKAGTSRGYNSNHGTWLERVGGGGMGPLGWGTSLAFSCLEHEEVDNVEFLPPYNST